MQGKTLEIRKFRIWEGEGALEAKERRCEAHCVGLSNLKVCVCVVIVPKLKL